MPFTLETIGDFDQTFFNDGTGWAIVFEIHRSIGHRAKAVGHTIAPNYTAPFSGIIWLQDGLTGGDPPNGVSLRAQLEAFYNDIEQLLEGDDDVRFTETSGRSDEWTLASITTDIAMGDFADLLIRPQAPEPLVWLIAALNRMVYPKLRFNASKPVDDGFREYPSEVITYDNASTAQDNWDGLIASPEATPTWTYPGTFFTDGDRGVKWQVQGGTGFSDLAVAYPSTEDISPWLGTPPALYGTVIAVDYIVSSIAFGYLGGDLNVTVGSSASTAISFSGIATLTTIEAVSVDFTIGGSETISITLDDSLPATVPFDEPSSSGERNRAVVDLVYIWLYIDLPDVMGSGALTSTVPVISGSGEVS